MKKTVLLTAIFFVSLFGVLMIPKFVKKDSVNISKTSPEVSDYYITKNCTGNIENSSELIIKLDYPIVIKKYCININDEIKQGDILFIIDKEATINLLKDFYSSHEIEAYKSYIDNFSEEYKSKSNGIVNWISDKKEILANENIIKLSAGSGYIANIAIKENDISNIKLGQNVEISGVAFNDKKYTGKISSISDIATKETIGNTSETIVNAVVDIDNADTDLKTGYNINAKITIGTIKNAIKLPYEVIHEDDGDFFVYKLISDNFAKKSKIDVLFEEDNYVIINGNIDENTILCRTNDYYQNDILRVNITAEDIKY